MRVAVQAVRVSPERPVAATQTCAGLTPRGSRPRPAGPRSRRTPTNTTTARLAWATALPTIPSRLAACCEARWPPAHRRTAGGRHAQPRSAPFDSVHPEGASGQGVHRHPTRPGGARGSLPIVATHPLRPAHKPGVETASSAAATPGGRTTRPYTRYRQYWWRRNQRHRLISRRRLDCERTSAGGMIHRGGLGRPRYSGRRASRAKPRHHNCHPRPASAAPRGRQGRHPGPPELLFLSRTWPHAGRVKRTVVPRPWSLSAQMAPPWPSTMPRAMARPSPAPPVERLRLFSPR